ncbi:MAG: hypothetical protein MUC35_03590 [Candidatus Margulisbacteria bacterium]|nr:hypothetical protein [Candidatus Margulisiibacteriota bacterium]
MSNMRTQVRKSEWQPTRNLLPLILGQEPTEALDQQELQKLELFEKGLAREIKESDTIALAVAKMVRMALAAEFGPSLVTAQGARPMVETITNAILNDPQLKKQALIIIDRFAR